MLNLIGAGFVVKLRVIGLVFFEFKDFTLIWMGGY